LVASLKKKGYNYDRLRLLQGAQSGCRKREKGKGGKEIRRGYSAGGMLCRKRTGSLMNMPFKKKKPGTLGPSRKGKTLLDTWRERGWSVKDVGKGFIRSSVFYFAWGKEEVQCNTYR